LSQFHNSAASITVMSVLQCSSFYPDRLLANDRYATLGQYGKISKAEAQKKRDEGLGAVAANTRLRTRTSPSGSSSKASRYRFCDRSGRNRRHRPPKAASAITWSAN
jgi:hypothetical protein